MKILLQNLVFLVFIVELILLFVQLSHVLSRPKSGSHKRFLILLILFLNYNIVGIIFRGDWDSIGLISEKVILYEMAVGYISGILAISYYFYFIITESGLKMFDSRNIKRLIFGLIVSFILTYGIAYLATENLEIAEISFLLILVCVGLYLFYQFAPLILNKRKVLKRKKTPFGMLLFSSYYGMFSIGLLPLFIMSGVPINVNFLFINFSFLITTLAFYRSHYNNTRLEYKFLEKMGYKNSTGDSEKTSLLVSFRNFDLTPREIEIAVLILQGNSYDQIADSTFIASKTVSKHASNIFKKTNTLAKIDFIKRFSFKG